MATLHESLWGVTQIGPSADPTTAAYSAMPAVFAPLPTPLKHASWFPQLSDGLDLWAIPLFYTWASVWRPRRSPVVAGYFPGDPFSGLGGRSGGGFETVPYEPIEDQYAREAYAEEQWRWVGWPAFFAPPRRGPKMHG